MQLPNRPAKPVTASPPKTNPQGTDVKPRLTKEQHDILEAYFQQNPKPSTKEKAEIAGRLGVILDKINNWFQNRRAKVKHEAKKAQNQCNEALGFYGPPQMLPQTAQFPQSIVQPPLQPQHPAMSHQFYAPNLGFNAPNADGSSMAMGVPTPPQPQLYDIHLGRILETEQAGRFDANTVMQHTMAAALGPSYMQHRPIPGPMPDPGFGSMPNAPLDNPMPHNEQLTGNLSLWNSYPPPGPGISSSDMHNSTGSASSEHSPFSTEPSTVTSSSNGLTAASVNPFASVYSNYKDDQNSISESPETGEGEDSFEQTYSMAPGAVSSESLPYWPPMPMFSQPEMYQHTNASTHAALSPGQSEDSQAHMAQVDADTPVLGDAAYSRRNSSTTNLAHTIEAIHIENTTPDGFKHPTQPSSIASRRQKRPKTLVTNGARSSSFTAGMDSPGKNHEHTLRRIRSSGNTSAAAGRIQKPISGSAPRSPMYGFFADSAASPKFARTAASCHPGSLAPPTPLTPSGMGEAGSLPYWTDFSTDPSLPQHCSPESADAVFPMGPAPVEHFVTSWPLPISRDGFYRDTPPQSAPATQQTFRGPIFPPPQPLRNGIHSTTDLTVAHPKPLHCRRPSLPDATIGQKNGIHMPHASLTSLYSDSYVPSAHNVPFAPHFDMDPHFVLEYPPQQHAPGSDALPQSSGAQPQKSYVFANQGPGDFR